MLKNRLNITSETELARVEEHMSKRAAMQLYTEHKLDRVDPGSFDALAFIHKSLFGELYEFAGEVRSVNLIKGNFRFASAQYLDSALRAIEAMPQNTFDEIVDKYIEMNVAHPFREGNGRAARIWLDHIFRTSLRMTIDWSHISREDYLLAMERSPIRSTELSVLLKGALSADLDNYTLLARSIDRSYEYEGYTEYRAEELTENNEEPTQKDKVIEQALADITGSSLDDQITNAQQLSEQFGGFGIGAQEPGLGAR